MESNYNYNTVINKINQLNRDLDEIKEIKKEALKTKMTIYDKLLIVTIYNTKNRQLKKDRSIAIKRLEQLNKSRKYNC